MTHSFRILVADDDATFRTAIHEALVSRGYRTLQAADGAQAVQRLAEHAVDLALLDMHMPKLTGLEVAQVIRERSVIIPWILVSAALDDQIEAAARRAAALRVMSKPIRLAELTTVVRQVCGDGAN